MSTLEQRLRMAMMGPPPVKPIDLARACDIKQSSVSNWLSSRTKNIEGANLLAAARFLGVRPEWLATGEGPMREAHAQSHSETEKLRPNSPREQALIDLFSFLPKSEQNEFLRVLKERKQHYDLLLKELLEARKEGRSTLRKSSKSGTIDREFKSRHAEHFETQPPLQSEMIDRKFNNNRNLFAHRRAKTRFSERLSMGLEEELLENIENKKLPE